MQYLLVILNVLNLAMYVDGIALGKDTKPTIVPLVRQQFRKVKPICGPSHSPNNSCEEPTTCRPLGGIQNDGEIICDAGPTRPLLPTPELTSTFASSVKILRVALSSAKPVARWYKPPPTMATMETFATVQHRPIKLQQTETTQTTPGKFFRAVQEIQDTTSTWPPFVNPMDATKDRIMLPPMGKCRGIKFCHIQEWD